MLILAIDTSARDFSLALLNETRLLISVGSEFTNAPGPMTAPAGPDPVETRRSLTQPPGAAVSLFPALKQLMTDAKLKFEMIELIAVATGPGMFTGLRIGVVAAKTLAYINQTPLISVNTLEVIAARAASEHRFTGVIRPVLNAQRTQLFAGVYRAENGLVVEQSEPNQILDREVWIRQIGENELLTGTGLKPMISDLKDSAVLRGKQVRVADPKVWASRAPEVGSVGLKDFGSGRRDDFWKIEPFYFRPSAAEEMLISKTGFEIHENKTDH